MSTRHLLKFNPSISILQLSEGDIVLSIDERSLKIRESFPHRSLVLEQLSSGISETDLMNLFSQDEGLTALIRVQHVVKECRWLGLLDLVLEINSFPIAIRTSLSSKDRVSFPPPQPDHIYQLCPFAYCHGHQGHLLIESPTSHAQVTFLDTWCVLLIAELARPNTYADLRSKYPEESVEKIQGVLSLLLGTGMIIEDKEDHELGEVLRYWEFHDLLFHSRSRSGRHLNPIRKVKDLSDKGIMGSANIRSICSEPITLYRPDISQLEVSDITLTRALESRRSVREHHSIALTIQQLGEFLYRSSRVQSTEVDDTGKERIYKLYPSGGACHSLEIYAVANRCQGLEFGLYHYNSEDHCLEKVQQDHRLVSPLLLYAKTLSPYENFPDILFIVSARFDKNMRYYSSISYSLILKEVGSLYQTMYLVATSMDLVCCALGVGDSDHFSAVVGTNYYAETSVGEIVLGRRPFD